MDAINVITTVATIRLNNKKILKKKYNLHKRGAHKKKSQQIIMSKKVNIKKEMKQSIP